MSEEWLNKKPQPPPMSRTKLTLIATLGSVALGVIWVLGPVLKQVSQRGWLRKEKQGAGYYLMMTKDTIS